MSASDCITPERAEAMVVDTEVRRHGAFFLLERGQLRLYGFARKLPDELMLRVFRAMDELKWLIRERSR